MERISYRKATLEIVEKWCQNPNLDGFAVVTGEISGRVVLDVDVGSDFPIYELPKTQKVKTGSGGYHFHFKYKNDPDLKCINGFRFKTDFKSDGGYAILPHSIHPNGNYYSWETSHLNQLAEMPFWLIGQIKKARNIVPTAKVPSQIVKSETEGNRNTKATQIIGTLMAYLPPHIWGNVVWPLINAWNDKNNPPLEEKELTTIYNSISSRELNDSSKRQPIYSSDEVTDDFSFFTLKELMENEAVKTSWLVEHLIPENGITCLAARMKTGKSFLTLQIAQSITQGTALFGKFEVKKTGVLIINKEDPEGLIKERLSQLKVDKNLPIIFSTDQRIFFHRNRYLQKILELVKKNNIGLVIADPFRMFFTGDENSSMEIRPVHQFFKQLTQSGLTVLFIHHYGKDLDGKNDGDKLRGSSGIGAMVDSALALERSEDDKFLKVFHIECRYSRKYPPFVVSFPTFENDDYQFKFLNSAIVEKSQKTIIRERIFELLAPVGKELIVGQIEVLLNQNPGTECGHGTVSKLLQDLAQTNQLISRSEGTKTFYSIPQKHSSQGHLINTTDEVTKGS